MKISTVTDEVISDVGIDKVFEIAKNEGVNNFEIRGVEGKRFPLIDEDMMDKLKFNQRFNNITYSAVSPGIFKTQLRSEDFIYHRDVLFEQTMNRADELSIKNIIIFGIRRNIDNTDKDYEEILDTFGNLSVKALNRGFTILIENEPDFWADTSENCLKLFKDMNLPNIKLNWDPGNLYRAQEYDYKPAYEKLKPYITNVHLKNAEKVEGKIVWRPLGEGSINYVNQISDLRNDNYKGCLTLETHCKPPLESFLKSVAYLKKLLSH